MKNEKGSVLLLSVVLLIIFSILGISILTLTSSGILKSETRDSKVQAQDLSEKGLDYVTEKLAYELKTKIGENGLPVEQFKAEILKSLNGKMCVNPNALDVTKRIEIPAAQLSAKIEQYKVTNATKYHELSGTNTGDAYYCIVSYKDSVKNGVVNELTKDITFLTKGHTNGYETYLVSTVSIGSNSIPDELNYALGTSMPANPGNGDGDILMLGGSEIVGNIYVAGKLVTSKYWGGYGGDTGLPIVHNGDEKSKIVLNHDKGAYNFSYSKSGAFQFIECKSRNLPLYSVSFKESDYCDNYRSNYTAGTLTYLNPAQFDTNKNLIFDSGSKAIKTVVNPERTSIKINESIEMAKNSTIQNNNSVTTNSLERLKFTAFSDAEVNAINLKVDRYNDKNKSIFVSKVKAESYTCQGWKTCYRDVNGTTFELNSGNYISKSNHFPTSVSITQNNTKLGTYKNQNGQGGITYIDGNLCIGNDRIHHLMKANFSSSYNKADKSCSNRHISTNSINVELEGAFYVTGSVIIAHANVTANSLIYAGGGFEIKDGQINGKQLADAKTGNFILFTKGPQHISGTTGELNGFYYSDEFFKGWGGNVKINGGVSGRRIYIYGDRNFRITYNPSIVETYSDLKHEEPKVYKIDTKELQNRLIQ